MWIASIVSSMIREASDSDLPAAMLNETVAATKLPWWLTCSGVVELTMRVTADSGTIVSTDEDTAEPLEVPRPLARLLLMLFCNDCELVESVVPVWVLLTEGAACELVPPPGVDVVSTAEVWVPMVCAPEPPPRTLSALLGEATRMVLLAVLPLAVPPAVLTQICRRMSGLCQKRGATSSTT